MTKPTKRYNLVLPDDLFAEVQRIADEEGVPTVEVFRRFIKLGLVLSGIVKNSDEKIVIRGPDGDREIIWV